MTEPNDELVQVRISRKSKETIKRWAQKYHWNAIDLHNTVIEIADRLGLANPEKVFESETQVPTKAELKLRELKRQGKKWKACDMPLCDKLDHFISKSKPGFYCTGGPAYGMPKMERLAGDLDEAQRICAHHLKSMAADRARKKLNAEVKLEKDEFKLKTRIIDKIIRKDKRNRKKHTLLYPDGPLSEREYSDIRIKLSKKDMNGLSRSLDMGYIF